MDFLLTAAGEQSDLLALVGILALAVGGSLVADRLGVPSIVILLVAGLVVGPILGVLDPDALLGDLLFPFVTLAVGVILFEGGLLLNLDEVDKDVASVVRRLLTIGAVVTFAGSTAGAYYILGLELRVSTLLGAILVVSGPTVVLPLMRAIKPRGRVAKTMKWEGVFMDPVGALLAVVVYEIILAGEGAPSFGEAASQLAYSGAVGIGVGIIAAIILIAALRTYEIDESLQPATTLMMVIAAVAVSDAWREESGLIAAILMGMVVANQTRVPVQRITEFKETLGLLLTSVLFIILAARLSISDLEAALGLKEFVFLAALVVVVRPLGVLLATLPSRHTWRERAFLASMAPRGVVAAAVASLFGLQLVEEGVAGAELLAPLTFFVILGTAMIAGLAGLPVARRLGISNENPLETLIVGGGDVSLEIARGIHKLGSPVTYAPGDEVEVDGLEIYGGHLLDGLEEADLDLSRFGHVIVASPSDTYNSLVATQLSEELGRARVFQLEVAEGDGPDQPDRRGRPLFDADVTYEQLERRLETNGGNQLLQCRTEGCKVLVLPAGDGDQESIELARWSDSGLSVVANDDHDETPGQTDTMGDRITASLRSSSRTVFESLVSVASRSRSRKSREKRAAKKKATAEQRAIAAEKQRAAEEENEEAAAEEKKRAAEEEKAKADGE
ncbi:MAG: cation:proton antiporter [Solirubrobacterales bacterium]